LTYTITGVLRLEQRLGRVRMVSATHRGFGSFGRGKVRVGVPLALAAGVLLSIASLPFASEAAAQASKAKAAKDAKSAAEAQRAAAAAGQQAYAAGVRSFESGDIARAEQQLSTALAGGGLPNAQMARALYYRGSAYRQLGRPAQAISDLTTAVWLKGGLPPDLKTKAIEARKLAYQEAGLGDSPPPIGAAPMDQSPSTPATAAAPATSSPGTQVVEVTEQSFWSGFSMPSLTGSPAAPAAPAAQTAAAPAGGEPQQQSSSFWSFLPSLGGSSAAEPAPPAAAGFATTTVAASDAAASAPAKGFGAVSETAQAAQTSSWDTATAASAAASPAPAQTIVASYVPPPEAVGLTAPSTPPPAAPGGTAWSNPLAGTGQAVSGFFSNMFSPGAAPAEATTTTAVTTGSTAGASGWETTDPTGATSQTSSMLQRGPDSPSASEQMPWATGSTGAAAAPARVATAAPGGRYKLQVAAVRSREEAERLAQSLSGYQPVRDGRVRPEIDETVIGSMGTFYRVRLGPYADSKEPGQLCATLKPQGFDCLVVTQ